MSDPSVFKENENPQETPAQKPTLESALTDQLKGIVNENGEPKYSTIEDALKGAAHAQQYIAELKGKLSDFEGKYNETQAELAQRKSVEEVVSRLTAKEDQGSQETPAPQGLDEATLSQLVEQQLNKRDQLSKAQQNEALVNETLFSTFGEKAMEIVQAKAKELNISVKRVQELSQESPQAVLSLFGAKQSNQGASPTMGTQRLPDVPKPDVLEKPKRSLLAGASSRDQAAYLSQIREQVYKKHNIQA